MSDGYTPLPPDGPSPPPSGILPNTFPDSVAVWTVVIDPSSGQRTGDAVMQPQGSAPGPDPNELVVARAPRWDNGNVYDPERDIACEAAVFTGGRGDVTYRYRWQWRPKGDNWISGAYSGYLNTPEGLIFNIPKEAQDGTVTLHCQAIDVYEDEEGNTVDTRSNSFATVQDVSPLPPFQVVTKGRIDQFIEPGGTYTCVPAIWEGGTDEATYRGRWEWMPTPNSIWQLGDWQEYPNDALLAEVTFDVPINAGGGRIRILSQARDPYVLNSNDYSNEVDINIGAVAVGNFTIEGLPYVGQTIVANQPMVVGGVPPYNLLYDFGNGTQQNATYIVQQEDVNRMISCMVTAIDTNFNSDSKSSTNQIGNIQPAMSLSPATTEINGEIADVSEYIPGNNDQTYTIVCTPFEYPNDFDISFRLTSSNGSLAVNPVLSEEVVFTPAETDVGPTIIVNMTSAIAGDHTYSIFFNFLNKQATEIGNITCSVNDVDYNVDTAPTLTVLMNDPCIVILDHDGDANPTAHWDARNEYPVLISEEAEHVVMTFPQEGNVSVTCTLIDDSATDSPQSQILNFWVVDAKKWAELQSKENS